MKISIAMATYNGAKYLQQQLDSFVAQTRQPDEMIVCDDASSDTTTVDILESFQRQAPFTVLIYRNEKNLGYIKNFEKALIDFSLKTGRWNQIFYPLAWLLSLFGQTGRMTVWARKSVA